VRRIDMRERIDCGTSVVAYAATFSVQASRRGLGLLEDQAAATGAWNASLSVLVDRLIVAIEGEGC
jgi:hypothetical protein